MHLAEISCRILFGLPCFARKLFVIRDTQRMNVRPLQTVVGESFLQDSD